MHLLNMFCSVLTAVSGLYKRQDPEEIISKDTLSKSVNTTDPTSTI